MLVLKAILILTFGAILYQDIKERQVYWFLFPIVALSVGLLFFYETLSELFLVSILINLVFLAC